MLEIGKYTFKNRSGLKVVNIFTSSEKKTSSFSMTYFISDVDTNPLPSCFFNRAGSLYQSVILLPLPLPLVLSMLLPVIPIIKSMFERFCGHACLLTNGYTRKRYIFTYHLFTYLLIYLQFTLLI